MFKLIKLILKVSAFACTCLIISTLISIIWFPVKLGEFSHEDMGYTIDELIKRQGYPFENHTVTTQDGYILEIHRIPHGKISTNLTDRPAIIINHGLTASSLAYLIKGRESLPYHLAEEGYDVWLMNCKGNAFSRKHVKLHPDVDGEEFFNYSWHEIGLYDIPAVIDHVIQVTGQERVFYSGHSQGSVSFFVMLSERPEYSEKIRLMVALAPVVFTKDIKSWTFWLPAMFQNTAEWLTNFLGIYELLPKTNFGVQVANMLCCDGSYLQNVCLHILSSMGGYNNAQLNKTMLPFIVSHMPHGSSIKQLFHYTQLVNSGEFQQYDHGEAKNLQKYGQKEPPKYKFENMRAPVALFYGANDLLTVQTDFDRLEKNLPNVILTHRVSDSSFNHFDFLLALNAKDVLYKHIVDIMKKY